MDGKGYHIAQLEPMSTIFARSVACAQSLKFGGILQDVLQESKPLHAIDHHRRPHWPPKPWQTISRGWRSNSKEASATNDEIGGLYVPFKYPLVPK
jgi:hypothetical protein